MASAGAPAGAAPRACAWVSAPEAAGPQLRGLSEQLVDAACKVCEAYLGRLEHEDIDLPEDATKDLTEDEWKELTRQYYALVQ